MSEFSPRSRSYSTSDGEIYEAQEPLELESNSSDPYHIRSNRSKRFTRKQMLGMICCLAAIGLGLLIGLLGGLLTRDKHSDSPSDNGDSPIDIAPLPPISIYKAAAVQYMPIVNESANETIHSNLQAFEDIVAAVSGQDVKIVVFPEGSLGHISIDTVNDDSTTVRSALSAYCEVFPSIGSTPYTSMSSAFNPQLTTLSRLANEHRITIVANLCQREICIPGQSAETFLANSNYPFARYDCPADGQYLWTSNVAFHSNGSIAAVYAKSHLFDSTASDSPKPTPVSFISDFGVKFGMLTSFDIEFAEPQSRLLKDGVQQWVLTSSWETNQPPQLTSNMIFNSWATRWGVNLIAANHLKEDAQGGGIYSTGFTRIVHDDPTLIAQPGQYVTIIGDLPVMIYRAPAPLEAPNQPYEVLPSWSNMAVRTQQEDCEIGAVSMQGSCVFLQPSIEQPTITVNSGYVTCRALIHPSSTTSAAGNVGDIATYAIFASEETYDHEHTPSSLIMDSCFLMRCVTTDDSTVKQCSSDYGATVAFDGIQLLAGLDCDRFAAVTADSTSGIDPTGQVLPMLATERANVQSISSFSFEYAGKFDGMCWWSMNLTQPLHTPLFSMGMYAVQGRSNIN